MKNGTRVISPNGNPGTVIGYTSVTRGIVAIKLDDGRQISALADKCQPETPEAPGMRHTIYAITAQVLTTDGNYNGSRQVPTFYLDSDIQGIRDAQHAIEIAKNIIDPMGTLYVRIHAEPVEILISAA